MNTSATSGLLIVERILRDREEIWRQIAERRDLVSMVRHMVLSSSLSLALFGAVLGSSNGLLQAVSSTIKLPVLFLATLAICLPTLYLFNLVFGARLLMSQAVALIMVCVTVTSVLTLAFAPISLFFRITAQSYPFFKLLNVCVLLLTALVGLRFLTAGMRALNEYPTVATTVVPASPPMADQNSPALTSGQKATSGEVSGAETSSAAAPEPAQSASMTLLYIWIMLFGFVGTQLAWTLRPFFGSPDEPFQVFRSIEGTFYWDILHTIGHLLGG
ncbi:MAG: hypothetical protein JXA67_06290 [Micromonosporaceae bacterium]|nr:hypothetical protein [Micromonosporaceae bacterium]